MEIIIEIINNIPDEARMDLFNQLPVLRFIIGLYFTLYEDYSISLPE